MFISVLNALFFSFSLYAAESYQVKRVSPADKYLFLRSQHSSMINGLSGRYPLYGPVVQWAFIVELFVLFVHLRRPEQRDPILTFNFVACL